MNTLNSTPGQTNDHEVIMSRISSVHKQKMFNLGDIIEWASECETDYLQDVETMIGYSGLRLEVRNHKALIPCNVYRILKVYADRKSRGSDISFRQVKRWIYLDRTCHVDHVFIDFYGLQIDDNGIPTVLDGHMQAIEAFCVEKLYYEDWILQKISGNVFSFMHDDMVNKCRETRASMRHFTNEDLNKLHFIQFNLVPKIGVMDFEVNDSCTHFLKS